MQANDKIERMRELEVREERELLREYAYLNKLRHYVNERNVTAATKLATRIQRYEDRLERTHRRVMGYLEDMRADDMDPDAVEMMRRIEDDVAFYMMDINNMASVDEARLLELVDAEDWEELRHFTIKNLKRDIKRWLEIDRALIELENHILSV